VTARGKAITVAAAIVLDLARGLAELQSKNNRFLDQLRQSAGTQYGS